MEQEKRTKLSERDCKILCKKLTGFCTIDNVEYVMVCLPLSQSDHSSNEDDKSTESDAAKNKKEGDVWAFLIQKEYFANSDSLTRDELFYRINRLAQRVAAGDIVTASTIISIDDVRRTAYSDNDIIHLKTAPNSLQANIEVKESFTNDKDALFKLIAKVISEKTGEFIDFIKNENGVKQPADLVVRHAFGIEKSIKWQFVIGISGNTISTYFCTDEFWGKVRSVWQQVRLIFDKTDKDKKCKFFHIGESDLGFMPDADKCIVKDTTVYNKNTVDNVNPLEDPLKATRIFIAKKMLNNRALFNCCESLSLNSFEEFSLKI